MDIDRQKSGALLQRIDYMIEELQLIRSEVSDLLLREEELLKCEEKQEAVSEQSVPIHHGGITCVSSLEELYAMDFEQHKGAVEETVVELPVAESEPVAEPLVEPKHSEISFHEYDSGGIDDLFVASGSSDVLESAFEPKVSFDLTHRLSLADRYLFANELFWGNQAELMEAISDIERMSSWSQVESYLYDTRGFNKGADEVKRFAEFVQDGLIE